MSKEWKELLLLVMREEMKEVLDKGGFGRVLLADLSKIFACLKHGLLILKLAFCGFGSLSRNFVSS